MKTAHIYTGSGSAIEDYNNPKKQLQDIVIGGTKFKHKNWGFFDNDNKQHKTILSQMRQLKWTEIRENREVPHLNRLSDFLKSDKSPINKPLKDMTTQELSKLIACFDSMINKKIERNG